MKKTTLCAIVALLIFSSFTSKKQSAKNSCDSIPSVNDTLMFQKGYSEVNGIKMYYEIYGQGKPLVLIHGGGSTIQTTFGRVIPMLAGTGKLLP